VRSQAQHALTPPFSFGLSLRSLQSLYSSALEVAPEALPARAIYYANRAAARLSLVRAGCTQRRGGC
jgi:hypothetical protein